MLGGIIPNRNVRRTPMVTPSECFEDFEVLSNTHTKEGWEKAHKQFPIRITRSWYERIITSDGPLARQVFPQSSEMQNLELQVGITDPVGEQSKMPNPYLVRKHKDRLLLLLSRKCHVHCRYCFRRTLNNPTEPTKDELQSSIDYILESGVEEVILSGGDPLFASNEKLLWVLTKLQSIPTIRIHTRAPVTFPNRVTKELVETLLIHNNVWMIVHCNHPNELNVPVLNGLQLFRDNGIPVLNQSVLLKGVNDDPNVLAELSRLLVRNSVFPYYLHHTDRVSGAEDFFVEVEDGLNIYRTLETLVSGLALPKYVIDLPDGSGKIPVARYWDDIQSSMGSSNTIKSESKFHSSSSSIDRV